MYKSVFIEFLSYIENFKDFEYLLALIKSTIAPTLSDLKLGTMMNLKNGERNLRDRWMENKFLLKDVLDIDFYELRILEDSVLVYFFKKKRLEKKLKQQKIIEFLNSEGYEECRSVEDYLYFLESRFTETCPDEIGIFLGYPLKDVIDFKYRDKKICKCTGYWKCFNNDKSSIEAFKRFDEVKVIEMKKIVEGIYI